MRIAYADPPYIGQGYRYPEKEEVDHAQLIDRLVKNFDAWALSCSTIWRGDLNAENRHRV